MLKLTALVLLAVVTQRDVPADAWGQLFSFVGAFGTAAVLGMAKRTDFSLMRAPLFRKLQPAITLLGAVAAPYVASVASSGVDISGLGQAPIATLSAVVGAELLAILKRST